MRLFRRSLLCLVVGVPADFGVPLAPEVDTAVRAAATALGDAGARVEAIAPPDWARFDDAFGTIFLAEAFATHVRSGLWPERRDEYPPSVARRVEIAERVTLPEYLAAAAERPVKPAKPADPPEVVYANLRKRALETSPQSLGSAGDVGHIQASEDATVVCRCGNVGCLEALAGGAAIGRHGEAAAREMGHVPGAEEAA